MKTISSRYIAILLIAISIIIGARAQVVLGGGTPLNLPFSNLEEYAATNSSIFSVLIYQIGLDGYSTQSSRLFRKILSPNQRLHKEGLNALFLENINVLFQEMLTEPVDPDFDFSREFHILAESTGALGKNLDNFEVIQFYHNFDVINFVRVSGETGDYVAPDISHIEMKINNVIAFRVKDLQWAVQQLYDEEGNYLSYGLKDGKNNPSVEEGWVDAPKELLYVDTRLITGQPQTYKVILNDGEYRVIDGSGVERPQIIPLRTSITNNHDGTVTIRVLGGDSYRTLLLEESTDFSDWVEIYRVERLPDYYSDQAFQITVPSTSHSFFRVKGL